MNNVKPGWQTTEFWLSLLATILGLVLQSGAFCTDHDGSTAAMVCKILGFAVTALGFLGYTVSRTVVKSNAAKADAIAATVASAAKNPS